jgi:hypothetical protein
MHCQQGGEVCACFGHLGVFGRCSNWFGQILSSLVQGRSHGAVRCVEGGLTAWGRRSNRPGQSEQFLLFAALVQGECVLAQGELAYVQGELFVVFELWIGGLRSLFEHGFCLGCVEPLPLPKGSETCLLQVILLFAFLWPSIAC